MILKADLHNHSCFSPCGDLSMSPSVISRTARDRGLKLVALTDHNGALNTLAFAVTSARDGILPLFGLELETLEEVHLLAVFATPREALEFGQLMYSYLPKIPLDFVRFGDEAVVDADEQVLGLHEIWCGASLNLSLDNAAILAHQQGALVIPAHVDRPVNSIASQLGFLPEGPFDAVEAIRPVGTALSGGLPVITGSDAHFQEHIGRRAFSMELPDNLIDELNSSLEAFYAKSWRFEPELETLDYERFIESSVCKEYPEEEAHALFESVRREGLPSALTFSFN